jgi:hypothetical protein
MAAHERDYLVIAHLQRGQDNLARRVIDESARVARSRKAHRNILRALRRGCHAGARLARIDAAGAEAARRGARGVYARAGGRAGPIRCSLWGCIGSGALGAGGQGARVLRDAGDCAAERPARGPADTSSRWGEVLTTGHCHPLSEIPADSKFGEP